MTLYLRSVAVICGILSLAGCIDINAPDKLYYCQSAAECPPDYFCDTPTQSCVRNGHAHTVLDMAMAPDLEPACDCPAPVSGCQTAMCDSTGTCVTSQVLGGTLLPSRFQTPGDCVQLVCDDNGNSVAQTDPSDTPAVTSDCETATCVGATPTTSNKAPGTPCGSNGVCNDNGQCGGCTPADVRCSNDTPQTCTADGVWLNGAPCAFVCVSGACTGACVPGAVSCLNNGPATCNNSGQWVANGQACPEVCSNGACTGACTPGTKQCTGNNVQETCDSSGKWGSDTPCQYVCSGAGQCTGSCVPGATQCASSATPQTCSSSGQWVSGSDCPYVCTGAGVCGGTCKPNSARCLDDITPQTCDVNGNWQTGTICTNACTGAGVCGGNCHPGARQCSGKNPQTCDNSGTWQNDPSGACQYVCSGGGVCGGQCNPGDKNCNGLTPQTCSSAGQWTPGTACQYICTAGVCSGSCTPGTNACANTSTPETCDANGNWQTKTACTNSVCLNGVCSGTCTPGTMICNGNVSEKCDSSGNYDTVQTCAFGCTGAGVCSALTAPTPTVLVDGSDISVGWTDPGISGVTCHMERSSNGGSTWAQPATSVSPCPANAKTPCSAYDPWLLRASYVYSVVCSGSGSTARSTSVAATPGIELCGTTYSKNSFVVDGISPGTVKTERSVTNTQSNAGFTNAWGIAADTAAGEIWVSSHDNNTIMVFTRTANDPTGLTGSRSLYVSPEGATTSQQPTDIALLGNEVIIATRVSPYYLAGYPRTFTSSIGTPSTVAPNWWIKGTAAGLSLPISLATDGGNLIYVGNGASHNVTVYHHDTLVSAAATNHTALPAGTVTLTGINSPTALAVDATARELFIADESLVRVDVMSADATAGSIKRTITVNGSPNCGLSMPIAMRVDSGTIYVLNYDTGIVASIKSTASDADAGGAVGTKLLTSDFGSGVGLAVCN
ncbi:MAG TPA: hypothetical protein VIA18_23065 [Polyangia bacterium]|nr:hypothetical protein [Polyangia bacterium]